MEHVHTNFGRFFGVLFAQLRIFLIYNLFSPIGSIFLKENLHRVFLGFSICDIFEIDLDPRGDQGVAEPEARQGTTTKIRDQGCFFLVFSEKAFSFSCFRQ